VTAGRSGIGSLVRQRGAGVHLSHPWSALSASSRADVPGRDLVLPRTDRAGFGIVVADGALGEDGGRAAAVAVMKRLEHSFPSEEDACELLADADMDIASEGLEGEASAACAYAAGGRLWGAAAGDCDVLLVRPDGSRSVVTAEQNRRPRIGGSAAAVPFSLAVPRGSLVIVATDGLWVNVSKAEVAETATRVPAERLAGVLLAGVFQRKGGLLPDDLAVGAFRT
jgi:serine/threonine protein phosphatase PrpC